ncbi:hypothetical protein JCM5296_001030 [Sporobolomyces johnsonii]
MASFNVQSLKPDITAILASADRSSVSAKAVRKALQAKYPDLNVKLHKAEIDEMTTAIFTASSDPAAAKAPSPEPAKPHLPSFHKLKRERSPSDEPTSSPAFPLNKVKSASKRKEESDEELARRLQAEYAQPVGRATRNGGANSKPKKPIKKKKSKSRVSDDDDDDDDKPKKKRKVSQTGFNKPHLLSPEMAEVCGQEVLSRPGVTKALWKYIKANDLQDPNKKTDILPDETLKRVLPFDRINSFTMAKHISPHLFPYDPEEHGHLSGAVEPVENEVKSEDLVNSDSE